MKFLAILLLLTSCSSTSTSGFKNNSENSDYLENFKDLENQMKPQTKKCLGHTQDVLIKPIIEKKIGEKKYEFQFKSSSGMLKALSSYNPANFDWQNKAKLKALYLAYPYSEDLIHAHLDKLSNLKDCSNDFDHFNFITAINNAWKKNKKHEKLYKKVIAKYVTYMQNNETPLITLLTFDYLLQLLNENEFIKIKDVAAYNKASASMGNAYTEVGKSILLGFKDKDYEKIYNLDKKLLENQKNFKRLIFNQISLLK